MQDIAKLEQIVADTNLAGLLPSDWSRQFLAWQPSDDDKRAATLVTTAVQRAKAIEQRTGAPLEFIEESALLAFPRYRAAIDKLYELVFENTTDDSVIDSASLLDVVGVFDAVVRVRETFHTDQRAWAGAVDALDKAIRVVVESDKLTIRTSVRRRSVSPVERFIFALKLLYMLLSFLYSALDSAYTIAKFIREPNLSVLGAGGALVAAVDPVAFVAGVQGKVWQFGQPEPQWTELEYWLGYVKEISQSKKFVDWTIMESLKEKVPGVIATNLTWLENVFKTTYSFEIGKWFAYDPITVSLFLMAFYPTVGFILSLTEAAINRRAIQQQSDDDDNDDDDDDDDDEDK